MTKELLKQYADVRKQIEELEEIKEKLGGEIAAGMQEQAADKIESDFGQFYFTTRKTWKYSPAVDEAVNELKAVKKEEEEKGIATFTESKSLTFKAK